MTIASHLATWAYGPEAISGRDLPGYPRCLTRRTRIMSTLTVPRGRIRAQGSCGPLRVSKAQSGSLRTGAEVVRGGVC